jgi:soluble lytic murein transglycosylase-like protein
MIRFDRVTPPLLAVLAGVLLWAPGTAGADPVYYYEDGQGTARFSDEPPAVSNYMVREERAEEAFRSALRKYSKDELRALIARFSAQLNIEPALVEAVVKAESEYDSMAVSKKGARGLMQLMPRTAKSLGVSDLHDPMENLQGGIAHLKKLLDHFQGNIDLAVAAYNAGEKAVSRHKGIPPYQETVDYVNKVRKYYSHFVELSSRSASLDASRLGTLTQ